MRRLMLCIALVLVPAADSLAQEGPALVVPLDRATPVREYAGHVLFSRFDGERFNLSVWRNGQVRDLAVRSQRQPFDADAGPDSRGRPSATVSLCDGSCDLFVIGFGVGDRLRPVRNANTTGHDETDPTVWKGRLAFSRSYGRQDVPYTKLLQVPRSRPSDRLAALPARRCGAGDPPSCREIKQRFVEGLELWGRWVAQSWTYQPDAFPGFRQNEIRLTDVRRTDTRQVAYMTTGLGGQEYLGPSIAEGRVAFFKACHADPEGCHSSTSGALRYRISTGGYEIDGANKGWSSWAWSGAAAYHVPSSFDCGGGDGNVSASERCGLYRHSRGQWRAIDAGRVR